MVFSVIGAMAEYERNLMRERTMAGLAAARARGRMGGRPKQLDEGQVKVAAIALAECRRTDNKGDLRAGWLFALYLLSADSPTLRIGTGV